MTQASRFRAMLRQDGMIVAPGAYDGMTGRLVEQAGFSAVYMTGAAPRRRSAIPITACITMSEMVDNAGRIAAAVACR